MSNNYLEVTNLKKSFGGLQAVNVESIKLKKNELLKLGSNKLKIKSFFQGKKNEKSVIQSAVFQKS